MTSVNVLSCVEVERPDSREEVWVKRGIWLYFWLIIFEGTLRKWILPQFGSVLLVIRDPIALFIYWKAFQIYPRIGKPTLIPFGLVSVAMIILASLQLALHITSWLIVAYGLRSYLLHLPLILVIARTMDIDDVRRFGR